METIKTLGLVLFMFVIFLLYGFWPRQNYNCLTHYSADNTAVMSDIINFNNPFINRR